MSAEVPDPVYVLQKDGEIYHSLLFTKHLNEEQLLTGTEGGQIFTWNLSSGRTTSGTPLKSGSSSCFCLRRMNDCLLSQNKDGLVKFWTLKDNGWTLKNEVKLNYFGFCKFDVGEDLGGIVVCPTEKSGVEILKVDTGEKIAAFQHKDNSKVGELMACKIINKNGVNYVITIFESTDIAVWDFKTMKIVSQLQVASGSCPMAFDYDEKTGKGIFGSNTDKVVVVKTDDGMKLSLRHEFLMKSEGVGSIKIRPDGKVFAVGSWDGRVRIFASKTCRPLAVFKNHNSAILDMAFSPFAISAHFCKDLLATSAKDGKVPLLNMDL